ncbi:zincin [Neurospora crassa]|uniref:Metalloprotease 1 n=1 Tax=Neurospora crassa (strain ATCC 24698 / 74-OR23-1A / CBS 708.71 / DSM 1257 / FGSC 987) TaxID=367110 RepID=Q7S5Z5_NEUCR|nr:metalloprotease 1 [Neurospora crassa OR74A]EAA30940.1 metalloprotease 1 [Neurospora crassa OR74A]KHE81397.1 zincin [Neurospora crassa]|eukprot:XP_960176.1 metalloprotease 1 [Neurospora crassa OR74A]
MIFSKAVLAAAAMMASSTVFARRCGTPGMTPDQVTSFNTLATKAMTKLTAVKANFQKAELQDVDEKVIKVYVHVLANGTKVEDGYLDESQIHEQISVLNADFSSAKLSFNLQNISYTIDNDWANGLEEYAFKSQLRRGDYSDLNLYFPLTLPDSLLGYSHFPVSLTGERQDATSPKDIFLLDGVVIRSDTLPFGNYAPYNLGRTATHETGHWFGLDHTFGAGGCEGKGDMIADTPFEASPAYGCPVGRDSCPDQEGLDPIHNFMDYSDDGCMEEFTPLQKAYMHSAFETYRQNVAGP